MNLSRKPVIASSGYRYAIRLAKLLEEHNWLKLRKINNNMIASFKKSALLLLAAFMVNIIFASNSFACKRLLEEEDTNPTFKRQRIEHDHASFLPPDILYEIFGFLPFEDSTNSSLTCKMWHEVHQSFLKDFVWRSTCNESGRGLRCQFTISQLPKERVQKALFDLHAKDGYVSLSSYTFPWSYLPVELKQLSVEEVKQHIEITEDFYHTVFGKALLNHDAQKAALDHLLATCRLYFHQDNKDENIITFFRNKKERFIHHLKEQSDIQPYVSFENTPDDLTAFTDRAYNIVVIDTQLENEDYENKLETLLEKNLDHRLILSVGKGMFVEDGTLRISSDDLPSSVQNLSIVNPEGNITTIEEEFLNFCESFTSFDTSGFINVTIIGEGFLYGCKSLTSFDTSGFANVTTIEGKFLSKCGALKSFDSSGLTKLTTIGDECLCGCKNLTSFDTSGFTNVTKIGDNFLNGCKSLTSFNTLGFANVTKIGYGFLYGCESLTSFDPSGLINIPKIGWSFLNGCKNLTSFNVLGLTNVTKIGACFLSDCRSLTSFDTSGFTNVTTISGRFLSGCESLTSFNVLGLTNVTIIGDGFLSGCTDLSGEERDKIRHFLESKDIQWR